MTSMFVTSVCVPCDYDGRLCAVCVYVTSVCVPCDCDERLCAVCVTSIYMHVTSVCVTCDCDVFVTFCCDAYLCRVFAMRIFDVRL